MVQHYTVYVTSHYIEDRTKQLSINLESMLGWKNALIRAVIVSNVDTYETSGFLGPWRSKFKAAGHELELSVASDLDNPRMLTWWHKRFLKDWAFSASPAEDFFVYVEDDIILTNQNIDYFLRNVDKLKKHGLIPGFMRYENFGSSKRAVDVIRPEFWQRDFSKSIDKKVYHSNRNPYWAGFILDKDLAAEYIRSKSFHLESSEFVGWNIQERAAMGLTFEKVPRGMQARCVIPIDSGMPDPGALVWHCSENYSSSNHPVFGRLNIEECYLEESLGAYIFRRIRETPRFTRRLIKKVLAPFRPDLKMFPY